MSDCVIDIETVGADWDALDPEVRTYLTERERRRVLRENEDTDPLLADPADSAAERLALEMGLIRIVAIGMRNVDTATGKVLIISPEDISGGIVEAFPTEEAMLREFWELVTRFRRVITFNGRSYDGPALMIRSAQLGVVCKRDMVGYRYDLAQHCDLADVLKFQGALWGGYSLDYWCRAFGIESPKQDVAGSDVARLFAEGRVDAIASYVWRDVSATAELYEKLKPMSWLFKGGPARPELAAVV